MRFAWWLLYALIAIDAISIFGYATYSLHPEALAQSPWAAELFGYTYAFFARAQIVLAFFSLACALTARVKGAWFPSWICLSLLSLASETIGVAFGVPFGKYAYTGLLGPKILEVPWLIPVSWYFMSVSCFRLACARESQSTLARCLVSALLLSAWDLTLDPAMSHLSPFWLWGEKGLYYGSPLLNLFGWFITALLLAGALEAMKARAWLTQLDLRFALAFYAANLLLPLGLVVCSGLWGAVAVSCLVYAAIGAWIRFPPGAKGLRREK